MSEEQAALQPEASAPSIEEQAAQNVESAPTEQAAQVEESAPSAPEVSETQKRINQLTREKYEAQRQAQANAQQLEQMKQQAPQVLAPADAAPTLEQFDFDEEKFQSALVQHQVKQQMAQFQQQQQQQVQQAEQRRKEQAYSEKVDAFKANAADFQESVGSMPLNNQTATDAIFASENGPAVAYHLSKNLDVVDRINQMPPIQAALEIGRIEAKLSAAPPPKPSTAPDPIETIAPGGSVPGGLDKYEVKGATFD